MNLADIVREFPTEESCEVFLASQRWPDGVECVACGSKRITRTTRRGKVNKKTNHQSPDQRLYECVTCRKQFTVRNGTLYGDTHIPLKKWFMAIAMICQAKKGISANQLGRDIGVSTKTAWYLCHRIREAMTDESPEPMDGLEYEMDETYVGGRYRGPDPNRFHASNKEIVVGIKQRGGDVRFFHVQDVRSSTLAQYIKQNVSPEATLICTDELTSYPGAVKLSGVKGLQHETVNHTSREYVRGNITTNSIEGSFSLFKRGLVGSYHRLSVKHLRRYLYEFQFRQNNRRNPALFQDVLKGIASKPRLPLRTLIDGRGAESQSLA